MEYRKITHAFQDERGTIADILYKQNVQHVAIIESHSAGLIRGNHYHKNSIQTIFITKGALRYWYQPLDKSEPVRSILVEEYGLVITPTYEVHALEIVKPNEFIVFVDGIRGGDDYESDTYRVDPILTRDMVSG